MPRTKPEMMRPPLMQSSMAISSAIFTGSLTAITFPSMAIFAFLVRWGDDSGVNVDGGLHAPVGAVVLVGHDAVEIDLVRQLVLVVVVGVEDVGLFGVEIGVGEVHPTRFPPFEVILGDVAIGLFGKPEYFELVSHDVCSFWVARGSASGGRVPVIGLQAVQEAGYGGDKLAAFFHGRGVSAVVDDAQLATLDGLLEQVAALDGDDRVLPAPDDQGGGAHP